MIMTLKKEWFEKFLSGEKTVEYREVKPYWTSRFMRRPTTILFRNGYSENSPTFTADVVEIKIVDGKTTDLGIEGKVYAIALENITTIKKHGDVLDNWQVATNALKGKVEP